MTPYSLKELGNELAGQGLDLAEDAAEKIYAALKLWLQKSAEVTEGPTDNFIMSFLPKLDALVNPVIDAIDGKKD